MDDKWNRNSRNSRNKRGSVSEEVEGVLSKIQVEFPVKNLSLSALVVHQRKDCIGLLLIIGFLMMSMILEYDVTKVDRKVYFNNIYDCMLTKNESDLI